MTECSIHLAFSPRECPVHRAQAESSQIRAQEEIRNLTGLESQISNLVTPGRLETEGESPGLQEATQENTPTQTAQTQDKATGASPNSELEGWKAAAENSTATKPKVTMEGGELRRLCSRAQI